jgi:hypothetical protein
MSESVSSVVLNPEDVASWAELPMETLLSLPLSAVEGPQREVVARRFRDLRSQITALDKLAERQGVDRVGSLDDALPVFFDHRVYKSYPLSLIEKRQFDRLTQWLNRLTTHDLTKIPLDGINSVDAWLDRLDEHGMIMGHSSGTSGKLSFIPHSQTDWRGWKPAYMGVRRVATGVDAEKEVIPSFSPGYRYGHHFSTKASYIFSKCTAGGEASRYVLFDYALSSDVLSLAGRMKAAEERGELDKMEFDPVLLEKRAQLIESAKHRDDDLEIWFTKLADEFRGQKVWIAGLTAELSRLAVRGLEQGRRCEFAPGSVLMTAGGLKGYNAPADWRQKLHEFFGIEKLSSLYGMSECMGLAPKCAEGYYHFLPFTVPIVLDEDANPRPRTGRQTGRMAVFDLLAESTWGGFITGDRVNVYWDEDCGCGWKGPRLDDDIVRFSELDGGDDKITCAGTAQAYDEFMDFVSAV